MNRVLKLFCVLFEMFFICIFSLTAFASKEKTDFPDTINMSVLNGPSGMCFAYMFENVPQIDGIPVSYEVSASPDVLLPKLLKNEIDIGILPPNLAAKIYARQPDSIIVTAVSGFGMLNLMSSEQIDSIEDLKGKTVYVAGQGSTPEYIFRALLEKRGISLNESESGSVLLDFSIPASELAAALISGKVDYAVMPEPFATVAAVTKSQNNRQIYRALDLQKLWKESFETATFPMTMIVVRKDFAQKYPETVQNFLKKAEKSIVWTQQNPKEAAVLVEKHTLGLKAQIAEKAIPNCAFGFAAAKESKNEIEALLKVFLNYAPASVGEKLPDDGFYFE